MSTQLPATHLHQGKVFFPPVEEFNCVEYRKKKKKSIVKRLFHRSSQSVCFKTRQLDKQKTQKQKMIKGSVSSPSNW